MIKHFNTFLLPLLALTLATGLAACDDGGDPKTGSETHFLRTCDGNCADGYACVCGVCTRMCTQASACTDEVADATCETSTSLEMAGACGQAPAQETSICALSCTADVDCAAISEEHVCFAGFCRAPPLMTADATIDSSGDGTRDMNADQDISCAAGETDCAGVCVDLQSDDANCGACGMACAAGEVCTDATCAAGMQCSTDADCQTGETCTAGVCQTGPCVLPEIECAGACVDAEVDSNNCGSCGNACTPQQTCTRGVCM